jgi:hypothetical protein
VKEKKKSEADEKETASFPRIFPRIVARCGIRSGLGWTVMK